MPQVALVTLSKYEDTFRTFAYSVERNIPADIRKIVVVDGEWDPGPGWERIQGLSPFSMAGNRNLGWRAAEGCNILDVGDDVTFTSPDTLKWLQIHAADSTLGLIAPEVIGGTANPDQIHRPGTPRLRFSDMYIPLICSYIPTEVVANVGYMDEQFSMYSPDDVDFSLRVKAEGYHLAITNDVVVHHNCTHTFTRNRDNIAEHLERGWALFETKWGHRNTH